MDNNINLTCYIIFIITFIILVYIFHYYYYYEDYQNINNYNNYYYDKDGDDKEHFYYTYPNFSPNCFTDAFGRMRCHNLKYFPMRRRHRRYLYV